MLRKNKNAAAGMATLSALIVLILAASVGWFILFSNDYVTVEAKISNPTGVDPITAQLDVRVTNHYSKPLTINLVSVNVWADANRSIKLSHAEISGVVVEVGKQVVRSLVIQVENAEYMGDTVWVDATATWTFGDEQPHTESVFAKPFGVNSALDKLLGRDQ